MVNDTHTRRRRRSQALSPIDVQVALRVVDDNFTACGDIRDVVHDDVHVSSNMPLLYPRLPVPRLAPPPSVAWSVDAFSSDTDYRQLRSFMQLCVDLCRDCRVRLLVLLQPLGTSCGEVSFPVGQCLAGLKQVCARERHMRDDALELEHWTSERKQCAREDVQRAHDLAQMAHDLAMECEQRFLERESEREKHLIAHLSDDAHRSEQLMPTDLCDLAAHRERAAYLQSELALIHSCSAPFVPTALHVMPVSPCDNVVQSSLPDVSSSATTTVPSMVEQPLANLPAPLSIDHSLCTTVPPCYANVSQPSCHHLSFMPLASERSTFTAYPSAAAAQLDYSVSASTVPPVAQGSSLRMINACTSLTSGITWSHGGVIITQSQSCKGDASR